MKNTKKSLVLSVIGVIMCVAMLIGTTFAWFTDTVTTGTNTIQAGTLDIDLVDENGNSLAGETLEFAKADAAPSDEQVLWEPGCTYTLPEVYIVNNGNLAVKYKMEVTGVDGDALLLEAIDFTVGGVDIATEGHLLPGEQTAALAIEGHMKEEADNRYQGLTLDGIGITVYAAQDTVEYDSIDNQYDANAEYLNIPIAFVDDLDTTTLPVELDVAKSFNMDDEEAPEVTEAYKDYYADFAISFSNAVNAGDVKVAGQYDSFGSDWVVVDCPALAAGEEYRLLKDGLNGQTRTYEQIRNEVQTFNCGAAANGVAEGTVMTVVLNLYSADGEVVTIGTYTYTF